MKLRIKLTLIILLLITVKAVADNGTDPEILTKDHAIAAYVNLMLHGKADGISDVLDDEVEFNFQRTLDQMRVHKKDMLRYFQKQGLLDLDCDARIIPLQDSPHLCVVRIDMRFKNFTRSNFVTVVNKGKGWKITYVYSVFCNIDPA